MRIITLMLLATMAMSAEAGVSPIPKQPLKEGDNGDLRKFQGKWRIETLCLGGISVSPAEPVLLEFSGQSMTMTTSDSIIKARIKLETIGALRRLSTTCTQKVSIRGELIGNEQNFSLGYVLSGEKLTLAKTTKKKGEDVACDPDRPDSNSVVLGFRLQKDNN